MIRGIAGALLSVVLGVFAQGASAQAALKQGPLPQGAPTSETSQAFDMSTCAFHKDGVLSYDITGGALRDIPLMQIHATGGVTYRAQGSEQSIAPVTRQTDIPAQEADTLLRDGIAVLTGFLTETPPPPASGAADTAISHLVLHFPDCDLSVSVAGLAFRAANETENAPLQALRRFEIRLLTLMNALRS